MKAHHATVPALDLQPGFKPRVEVAVARPIDIGPGTVQEARDHG